MISKFDSKKHHRRSIRLPEYDYSQPGAYYVTIVAWHRECLFGDVVDGEMKLNMVGKIVQWEWEELPKRLQYIQLGAYVVMPNHFHGILKFHAIVGATRLGLINARSGIVSLSPVTIEGIDGSPLPRGPCLSRRDHRAIQIARDKTIVENNIIERYTNLATQLL